MQNKMTNNKNKGAIIEALEALELARQECFDMPTDIFEQAHTNLKKFVDGVPEGLGAAFKTGVWSTGEERITSVTVKRHAALHLMEGINE